MRLRNVSQNVLRAPQRRMTKQCDFHCTLQTAKLDFLRQPFRNIKLAVFFVIVFRRSLKFTLLYSIGGVSRPLVRVLFVLTHIVHRFY